MAWGTPFLEYLAGRHWSPSLILRSWRTTSPPTGFRFTGFQAIASMRHDGSPPARIVDVTTVGQEVEPIGWSSRLGEWSVTVATDDYDAHLSPIVRGDLCELLCGIAGWPESAMETVELGILRDIVRIGPGLYRLDIRGAASVLGSRYSTAGESLGLFAGTAGTTTTRTVWTAGSGAINVNTTSGFRKETGGNGLIKVTPIGEGADPFFLEWSGTSAGPGFTLTTGDGALSTTAVDLTGSNDEVDEVAYVADHPIRAALKILASSGGGGANGIYDVLPDEWGMGIPESRIDAADSEFWAAQSSPATGSDVWHIYSDGGQPDPLAWLESTLSLGGWFVTLRQGRYTVRAGAAPSTWGAVGSDILTRADVYEIEEWSSYDAASEVGYKAARVLGPTTSDTRTEDVASLPAERQITLDVGVQPEVNEAAWLEEIADRIGPWYLRVPERIVASVSIRCAAWAPGTVIALDIGGDGRLAPYEGRRAWVSSVAPDWLRGRCRVVLLVLPDRGEL